MTHHADQSPAAKFALERLIFFSDAVFAIAITLLALELRVPEMPASAVATEMPRALAQMTPKYLSFILSFLVIGSIWVGHHRDFQHIVRFDRRLIWLNLLLLLGIIFLPFPTAMIGNYPAQTFTVDFYAGTLAAIGLVKALLWWYASHQHRLIDRTLDPRDIAAITRRGLITPLVFILSMVIAMYDPLLAMYSWGLVGVGIFLMPTHPSR